MKRIIYLLLFFPIIAQAQNLKVNRVDQVAKQCWISEKDGLYGLTVSEIQVVPNVYEYYEKESGLVVLSDSARAVCYNSKGEKLVDLSKGELSVGEFPGYIVGMTSNGNALYSKTGKMLVNYGDNQFSHYEDGMMIFNQRSREFAFFGLDGEAIIPFGPYEIFHDESYSINGIYGDGVCHLQLSEGLDVPLNFSKLDKSHFVSDREVTVGEYIAMLASQINDGFLIDERTGEYVDMKSLLPDTTKVEPKLLPLYRYLFPILTDEVYASTSKYEVLLASYSADVQLPKNVLKKFKNLLSYPLTGVSKEQAEMYCLWLENMYLNNEYDYYANVDFSLPTNEQWETMAKQSLRDENQAQQMPDSLNAKNCMLFVYKTVIECKNHESYLKSSLGGGSVNVKAPIPDNAGRSHVFGNVAEMISEEGKCKGGSYFHEAENAKYSNSINYTEPAPWLGFRIVGEYQFK